MRSPQCSPSRVDILLVEDDDGLRQSLRLLLEGEGYCCAEADNGSEALELARQCPPRLVLLDLMMPKVDGLSTARQLHADPRTRCARLYCLTARSDPHARREARNAGCEEFITKPCEIAVLLDLVCVALNS